MAVALCTGAVSEGFAVDDGVGVGVALALAEALGEAMPDVAVSDASGLTAGAGVPVTASGAAVSDGPGPVSVTVPDGTSDAAVPEAVTSVTAGSVCPVVICCHLCVSVEFAEPVSIPFVHPPNSIQINSTASTVLMVLTAPTFTFNTSSFVIKCGFIRRIASFFQAKTDYFNLLYKQ